MDNRTLDREIAEKFLGWQLDEDGKWWHGGEPIPEWQRVDLFKPSSDPVSCDLILDEIERRGWNWEWSRKWDSYFMVIYDLDGPTDKPLRVYGKAWHDNRYRAVCETALQAAGTERK